VDEDFAHRPRSIGWPPRVFVCRNRFSERGDLLLRYFELPQILAFEAGYSLRHGQRPFHGDIILGLAIVIRTGGFVARFEDLLSPLQNVEFATTKLE
jgi:hypothetical protein